MPRLQCKSFATPDEVRTFPSGRVEIILLDEIAIGRFAKNDRVTQTRCRCKQGDYVDL
jgi:hypothetical protein